MIGRWKVFIILQKKTHLREHWNEIIVVEETMKRLRIERKLSLSFLMVMNVNDKKLRKFP